VELAMIRQQHQQAEHNNLHLLAAQLLDCRLLLAEHLPLNPKDF
jgi:hypothetical protein